MELEIKIESGISRIPSRDWNALVESESPFLSYEFLSALEQSNCVGATSGWQPIPVLAYQDSVLVGAVPLYLKEHSYGEYVFDWSWANAYQANGLAYYPKLLSAIPFTPVSGSRLISHDSHVQGALAKFISEQIDNSLFPSAHILFPDEGSSKVLRDLGWMERKGIQFRWENNSFKDFEAFLSNLSHDKRKKIRQERKKIHEAGISVTRISGNDINERNWEFFFKCYESTYLQHRSSPYLNIEFFQILNELIPNNILLVIAERDGHPVASALNVYDKTTLYGRYWGALDYYPGLHFELCYYQGQEFCIENKLQFFEGGAQGEHKLARGFHPRSTNSFHYIGNPSFKAAIGEYLKREENGVDDYYDELENRAPFKKY